MRLDIDQGVVSAVSGRNLNALPALTTPPDRVAGVSGLETVNVPEAAGLHLPFAGRGPSSYKIAYIDLVTALISTLIRPKSYASKRSVRRCRRGWSRCRFAVG